MASALEDKLNEDLKAAMKSGDSAAKMALRMVRTKVMERRTAKAGVEVTDELVLDVLRAYVKSLQGSIDEYPAVAADDPQVAQMRAEIAYLDRYLPRLLDEAATQEIVDATLASLGVTDPKQAGRVTGAIMKDHKGRVDPGLVARLIRARLGA